METKSLYIVECDIYYPEESQFAKSYEVFESYDAAVEHYRYTVDSTKDEIYSYMKNNCMYVTTKETCYTDDFMTEEKKFEILIAFDMGDSFQVDTLSDFVTPELNFIWKCNPLRPLIKDCLVGNCSTIDNVKFATIKLTSKTINNEN